MYNIKCNQDSPFELEIDNHKWLKAVIIDVINIAKLNFEWE